MRQALGQYIAGKLRHQHAHAACKTAEDGSKHTKAAKQKSDVAHLDFVPEMKRLLTSNNWPRECPSIVNLSKSLQTVHNLRTWKVIPCSVSMLKEIKI